MNEETSKKAGTGLAIKIAVPLIIICVVFVIWLVKNNESRNAAEAAENPDFALAVTDSLDLEKLKSYGLPILIEFGSEACPPCRQMAPIIEALNMELRGKAIIKYADVWANPDLAKGYPLSVIPTQLFIDADGNPYNPEDPNALSLKLYSSKDTGELIYTTHEGLITASDLASILKDMGMEQ